MKIVLRTNFTIAMMYCTLEATRPFATHLERKGEGRRNGMTLVIMVPSSQAVVKSGANPGTLSGAHKKSFNIKLQSSDVIFLLLPLWESERRRTKTLWRKYKLK